jgi:hypothetical protein
MVEFTGKIDIVIESNKRDPAEIKVSFTVNATFN